MRKTILVFTNESSFKSGSSWFFDELKILNENFNIKIFCYEGTYDKHIESFVVKSVGLKRKWRTKTILEFWNIYFISAIIEFFHEKVYKSRYWIKSWISVIKQVHFLCGSDIVTEVRKYDPKDVIVYFYWGNNSIYLAPILKQMGYRNIVSRFHGFDLYKERLAGYQPFKSLVLKSLRFAIPISQQGKRYLISNYPYVNFETRVNYLGTKVIDQRNSFIDDSCFSIVSCSSIIQLKQVDLLAEALSKTNFPVKWTHIGDGPLFEKLKRTLEKCSNPLLEAKLLGWLSAEQVRGIYKNEHFDIFINTSSTEGIPVSIMEAFAAKIPAIAPRVGGIEEIVIDGETGFLLPEKWTTDDLLALVYKYHMLSQTEKNRMKWNAFERFQSLFNIEKNTHTLRTIFYELN